MKKLVKSLVLITIHIFSFTYLNAQLKLPAINGIGEDIKKVIDDYPNRFGNLLGELIIQNPQSTDYQCNFKVNGAEETIITRYTARKDDICSWESVLLTTENFEKAKQKFKSLYNQLNNLSINVGRIRGLHLKGVYEMPAEEKKFTNVLFSLEPTTEPVRKLRVEISMQYSEPMEWKVKVLVYDREREDYERGSTREE